jgi:leader peptidase (prepilin peptidase)/N-methyltransferase
MYMNFSDRRRSARNLVLLTNRLRSRDARCSNNDRLNEIPTKRWCANMAASMTLMAILPTVWMLAEVALAQTLRGDAWGDDPAYRWQLWFMYAFVYCYAFAFGASLASFLNVVVYRLPRRLNLVHPGSRCPACATPIEARDNIPVLGWLALRGRCRTCGAPIAPRYLLIELAIGGLFVLLVHLAVFRGGAHLPGRTATVRYGLTILYSGETWELGRMAIYHACLLSLLLVCGLIQYDRQRVPGRLWSIILAIGLTAGIVWPSLRPLPSGWLATSGHLSRSWLAGIADGLAGVLFGAMIGAAVSLAVKPSHRWPQVRRSIVLALASVGAYLGWQAAIEVAWLGALLMFLTALASPRWRWADRLPPLCLIMAAAWAFVPNWNRLHQWSTEVMSSRHAWPIVAGLAIIALALANRALKIVGRSGQSIA